MGYKTFKEYKDKVNTLIYAQQVWLSFSERERQTILNGCGW